MCENMLRMRGAYTRDVRNAFEILRSNETKYSWIDKRDAYDKIYKATNLVTTKYTAYGFRDHGTNGEASSDVAVAYYNKFALFPMFHCTATGKMADIYQKMLDEKVDMLMMDSAVKVGSQGAIKFDGDSFKEPFNKYVQSFAYLRR
jgi:dsDNA-binding SOS-regulon protein